MAQLPDRPQVATSPLELFENKYHIEEPWLLKYWIPGICGLISFSAVCYANWATKRPVLSGIQKHVLYSAGAAYVGKVLDDWKTEHVAERDAILKDYIRLHPEDFPPFERKKYGEILEKWIPVR